MRLMSEGLRAVTWSSSEVYVLKDHGIPIFWLFIRPFPAYPRPTTLLSNLRAVKRAEEVTET